MSKSAGGQKQTQNQTSSVDPQTQAWIAQIQAAAKAAGQAGPSPLVGGATDYNSGMMGAGATGTAALGGDADAAAKLMNPYQSQVINAANNQWDQNDQHTMNAVNDRATQAGAFGGSRQGVATGVALGQNNMNRNSQIGGLLSTGYTDTMNRAGQLAGMGANGAAANANLGMGGVGNPSQWLMQMLKQGYMGPQGMSSSGASSGVQTGLSFNPLAMLMSAGG